MYREFTTVAPPSGIGLDTGTHQVFVEGLWEPEKTGKLDPKAVRERRFLEKVKPLMEATRPVFDLLEKVGLQYALIRHVGMLFTLYQLDTLYLLEGQDELQHINDLDILIEFDRKKIDLLVNVLENLPGVEGPILKEYLDDPDRVESESGFLSDAFIKFTLRVQDRKFDIELFANFGTIEIEGSKRKIFAAIDNSGKPTAGEGNSMVETTYNYEHGSRQIPIICGDGVLQSYVWQDIVKIKKTIQEDEVDPKINNHRQALKLTLMRILKDLLDN